MKYDVTYKDIAASEYLEAINWYNEKSVSAAGQFIEAINEKLQLISNNPRQYKNLFRNYHETTTKRYPYTIVYFIDDNLNRVVIVAIYHHKRRPSKKYRI